MAFPAAALRQRLSRISPLGIFYRLADSNLVMILCTLIFLPALFSGRPLAAVMLGLLSISILRRLTLWRHRKLDIDPPYTRKTFLHYCLSFVILFSLLLALIVYHFLIVVVLATILNWMYLCLCAVVTFFTPRPQPVTEVEEEHIVDEDSSADTPTEPDEPKE